jgi:hypothetical protein
MRGSDSSNEKAGYGRVFRERVFAPDFAGFALRPFVSILRFGAAAILDGFDSRSGFAGGTSATASSDRGRP